MDSRQNVRFLVKFELKHSIKSLLFLIPILIVSIVFIRISALIYLEVPAMGLELFMFLALLFSQIARPKDFQVQKMNGLFYASPFLIVLNQLGVPKNDIVKYRFASYFITYSLFVTLLFIGLYPAFQGVLPVTSYLVFAFSWYCIGIYVGCIVPATEPSSNLAIFILFTIILAPVLFVLDIFLFYIWYQGGFITWMIDMSVNYPIWTTVVSLLLSVTGWKFWMKWMKRAMSRADYL